MSPPRRLQILPGHDQNYNIGPEDYLEHIRKAKQAVKIPIIASLNGVSKGGWIRYAKEMQQAGADALELNIYYLPTDPTPDGAATWKQCILRPGDGGEGERADPGGGEARAVLQLDGEYGRASWTKAGADATGAVQSLLPAGFRSREAWKWCRTWS